MMIKIKTIIFIHILFVVCLANAQNYSDSLGRKQGSWVLNFNELDSQILLIGVKHFAYDNHYYNIRKDLIPSKLFSKGNNDPNVQSAETITICNFKDDTLHGSFTVIKHGVKIYEIEIKKGLKEGIGLLYSPNGKLYRIEQYLAGNLYSIKILNRGRIIEILIYDGKSSQTGTFYTFRKSGKLKHSIEYRSGKIHGKEIYYWKNGNPKIVINYQNEKTISRTDFYRDGKIKKKWD